MYQIDRFGRTPIYEQIIEQTEWMVLTGTLSPGDLLPSVRTLSQELSANPNTLQKAYQELERRGVALSAPGSGRYVTKDAPQIVRKSMLALVQEVRALARRLNASGVEKQQVLDAVEAAYEAPSTAQAPTPSQTTGEKTSEPIQTPPNTQAETLHQ